MVDDFEALKGFTSEKYKEKVKQSRAELDRLVLRFAEHKKKQERKLAKKLFIAQTFMMSVFIGLVIGFILLWG